MALWSPSAWSHAASADANPPTLASAWTLDPWVIVPLLAASVLYAVGLLRYWRRSARGHSLRGLQAAAFAGGVLCLFFALVWPLDAFGEWLLSAHMAQHMLMIAVAAPLLMLGMPGTMWLSALPADWARAVAWPLRRGRGQYARSWFANTTAAAVLQAAVMWGWHAPAAMQVALTSPSAHVAMHASFLAAGLWFWGSLLQSLREPRVGFGAGFAALVGTMVQMGLLAALLTFAPTPRFSFYVERSGALGWTPLEDQQLAGLIMWVPSALPYLIGVLALTAVWLTRRPPQTQH